MKRILLWTGVGLVAAAIAVLIVLMQCTCVFGNHTFTAATCTEPETCTRCGMTQGEPLGHVYSDPTCTEREICMRCGERSGEPLGHVFLPATCTAPETCARCNATQGEPLGHVWTAATYQSPATCTRCGETDGDPLKAVSEIRFKRDPCLSHRSPHQPNMPRFFPFDGSDDFRYASSSFASGMIPGLILWPISR